MFMTTKRHTATVSHLAGELRAKEELVGILQQRLHDAERSRHEIVEAMRETVEAVGFHLAAIDPGKGEDIQTLGHVLPYLLTGRRHWNEPALPDAAELAVESATGLAARHGFALPREPSEAVKAMLCLATSILCPTLTLRLERLRERAPLK